MPALARLAAALLALTTAPCAAKEDKWIKAPSNITGHSIVSQRLEPCNLAADGPEGSCKFTGDFTERELCLAPPGDAIHAFCMGALKFAAYLQSQPLGAGAADELQAVCPAVPQEVLFSEWADGQLDGGEYILLVAHLCKNCGGFHDMDLMPGPKNRCHLLGQGYTSTETTTSITSSTTTSTSSTMTSSTSTASSTTSSTSTTTTTHLNPTNRHLDVILPGVAIALATGTVAIILYRRGRELCRPFTDLMVSRVDTFVKNRRRSARKQTNRVAKEQSVQNMRRMEHPFEGTWEMHHHVHLVTEAGIFWPDKKFTPINITSAYSFEIEMRGKIFECTLQNYGEELEWSDGAIWTRSHHVAEVVDEESVPLLGPTPQRSERVAARSRSPSPSTPAPGAAPHSAWEDQLPRRSPRLEPRFPSSPRDLSKMPNG